MQTYKIDFLTEDESSIESKNHSANFLSDAIAQSGSMYFKPKAAYIKITTPTGETVLFVNPDYKGDAWKIRMGLQSKESLIKVQKQIEEKPQKKKEEEERRAKQQREVEERKKEERKKEERKKEEQQIKIEPKNKISNKDEEAPIGDAKNESVAPIKADGETTGQQYIETAKQEFFKNKFLLFLWVGIISSAVMVFYYGNELDDIVYHTHAGNNLLVWPKPPLPAGNVTYCMGFMIIGSIFFHLFASLLYKEYSHDSFY
jgi:hypothetical protein